MGSRDWLFQMMQAGRLPAPRSGYYLSPFYKERQPDIHFHDFKVFNPKMKETGDLTTSWVPSERNRIFVEGVYGYQPGKYNSEGVPLSLQPGIRDLARQLKTYYGSEYPTSGQPRWDIGGYRVSGARHKAWEDAKKELDELMRVGMADAPRAQTLRSVLDRLKSMQGENGMNTLFKPAIAASPFAGAMAYPDQSNARESREQWPSSEGVEPTPFTFAQ